MLPKFPAGRLLNVLCTFNLRPVSAGLKCYGQGDNNEGIGNAKVKPALRGKCSNTEFFHVRVFLYSLSDMTVFLTISSTSFS